MPGKLNVYGWKGVNVAKAQVELEDDELTLAQNAIQDPLGSDGSLRKRAGLIKLNATAAPGTIMGIMAIPLSLDVPSTVVSDPDNPDEPFVTAPITMFAGRWLTDSNTGWVVTIDDFLTATRLDVFASDEVFPDETAPIVASRIDGLLTDGTHRWAYTWVTPDGETLPSSLSAVMTAGLIAFPTPAAPVASTATAANIYLSPLDIPIARVNEIGHTYTWVAVFSNYAGTVMSATSAASNAVTAIVSSNEPLVASPITLSIVIPNDPAITVLNIYRSDAGAPYISVGGIAMANYTPSPVGTTFTYLDYGTYNRVGDPWHEPPDGPFGEIQRTAYISAIAEGPPDTISRKLYQTAAGGTQLKLLATIPDNVTTAYIADVADASLGANAPTTGTELVFPIGGTPRSPQRVWTNLADVDSKQRAFAGRPGVMYQNRYYYAGNDYPVSIRMWNGSTDSLLVRVPSQTVAPFEGCKAVLCMLTANGHIYFTTYDSGSFASGTVKCRVFELDPEDNNLVQIGAPFPIAPDTTHAPYAIAYHANRVWVRTYSGSGASLTYYFRPGVDTAWTLDGVAAGTACTNMVSFQGQLYMALLGSAGVAASIVVRSPLGVITTAFTAEASDGNGFGSYNHFGAMIVFKDKLYCAYFNYATDRFCRLYSFNGTVWTAVHTPEANAPSCVPYHAGYVHHGTLFLMSSPAIDDTHPANSILKTVDGLTWIDMSASLIDYATAMIGAITV